MIPRSAERDEGHGESQEDDSVIEVRVFLTAGYHLRDPRGGQARRFPFPRQASRLPRQAIATEGRVAAVCTLRNEKRYRPAISDD